MPKKSCNSSGVDGLGDTCSKHVYYISRAHLAFFSDSNEFKHPTRGAYAPSIFQECRDYRRQRDQVSDQKLGAKLNVTKHVIDFPTV